MPVFDNLLRTLPFKQAFPGNLTQFVGRYTWTTRAGLRVSLTSHRKLRPDPASDGVQARARLCKARAITVLCCSFADGYRVCSQRPAAVPVRHRFAAAIRERDCTVYYYNLRLRQIPNAGPGHTFRLQPYPGNLQSCMSQCVPRSRLFVS